MRGGMGWSGAFLRMKREGGREGEERPGEEVEGIKGKRGGDKEDYLRRW